MPNVCIVPNCKGNYSNGPRVRIFSFPKDKELSDKWIKAINRDNFTPTRHSRVCELHFFPEDMTDETSHFDKKKGILLTAKINSTRLREGAVPSILPNFSSPTPSKKPPMPKKRRLTNYTLKSELICKQRDEFHSTDKLEEKLNFLDKKYWSVVRQEETLFICHIIKSPYPKMSLSLVIDPDCAIHVFCHDVEMHSIGEYLIPTHVKDTCTLEDVLNKMKTLDVEENIRKPLNMITALNVVISFLARMKDESFKYHQTVKFICEQLHLMTQYNFDYSSEMMIFSTLLYNCSPRGYKLLRDTKNVILPSYSTIRRITLSNYMNPVVEKHDNNFLMYIRNKFKLLSHDDRTVCLVVDEINLKPYSDSKGGNVSLADNSYEVATTAFAFMVSSICSKFKDVVHVMPAKCIKAQTLFNILKEIIIGLERIGFKVISVITDNNDVNKEAMSLFSSPAKISIVYPHPVRKSRPLFFLFDSVDLLKCIRNNWLDQKDANKCMIFPKFNHNKDHQSDNILIAPFTTLQKLHTLEMRSVLKYCSILKALSPTDLERQNVSLVLEIFNDYTIQGLLSLGKENCLPNFAEVAEFINIFHTWWTVLNVKSEFPVCQLNNKYAKTLTFNDENYKFLNDFCYWLKSWDSIQGIYAKLTKETFTDLHHSTHAILELTDYCLEDLKMKYILTGKLQTDHLEARFGQYRQHGDDQCNTSICEIFECEKKLRMLSVLKLNLPLNNQIIDLSNLQETNWDEMTKKQKLDIHKFNIIVTDDDINNCKQVLPVILYLAGYCCHAVFKKMKCDSCKNLISRTLTDSGQEVPEINTYFKEINRGSLLHPNETTTNLVCYNYAIIDKLTKNSFFLSSVNQQKLAMYITLNILADYDLLFDVDFCDEGHNMEKIERMLVWTSSNSLLNNFCPRENITVKLEPGL